MLQRWPLVTFRGAAGDEIGELSGSMLWYAMIHMTCCTRTACGNEAEPGIREGGARHIRDCKCEKYKYLRTWATYRLIRDQLMAAIIISGVFAPKSLRPVRSLHGCVVRRWGHGNGMGIGRGFTQSLPK